MTAVLDIPAVEPLAQRVPSTAAAGRRDFRRGAVLGAAGLVLAWPLGLVYLGWVVLGVVALLACLRHRYTTFPAVVSAWLVVLLLILLSGAQVETVSRAVAFSYRYGIYLAITVVCLYVYNARERLTLHRVMGVVAGVYVVVVLSGLAGLAFPDFVRPSLLLEMLPVLPPEARFVDDTLTMQLAELQNILRDGQSHVRPKGVFAYTNDWASIYTVLTVVLLSYLQQQRRLSLGWFALAGIGAWPLVASLSRAAWASLLVGLVVLVVARLMRAGVRQVLPSLLVIGLAGGVILSGPALDTIERRLDTAHSDTGRQARIDEAVSRVGERPLTGYGTPLPSHVQGGPSVGTHGQFWLLLFSQGYPGALAFLAFCLGVLIFAVRAGPPAEPLLAAAVVLTAQSFFYEWMALQLALLLVLTGATAAVAAQRRTPTPQQQRPSENEVVR